MKIGIWVIFIGILFLTLGITLGLIMETGEKKTIETDCYDEYNNKIIGLICEKEILKDKNIEDCNFIFFPSLAIGVILFSLGIRILQDE